MIRRSFEFMDYQRRVCDPCLVSYAEFTQSPIQVIDRISTHIGVNIEDHTIQEINVKTSRDELSKIAEVIETLDNSEVYRDGNYTYHRRTLIHRNHFREDSGEWKNLLSVEQLRCMKDVLHPWAQWW